MRMPLLLVSLALAWAGVAAAATVEPWPLPTPIGAAQPDLIAAPDGRLLLSWIARRSEGGHTLALSAADGQGRWGEIRRIASGADWFVNWADTPHLAALADGSLWAHWLRKSAGAPYAYDVVLTRSDDGGATWSAPKPVHDDGTTTEHGFVAFWPQARDRLGIAWLDGRHTGGGEGHDGHGGGAMTLRAAQFDGALRKHGEAELDASTCDCCQTDAAVTARGPVLVYRDRAEGEIRDILLTRFDGQAWTAPVRVHVDDWYMPACPVNGPAVTALGDTVWIAWYTGAGGAPSVRLARSNDAGATFAPMRLVDDRDAQGRVALAADSEQVWLAWTRENAAGQSLWLARYAPDLSRELERVEVAKLTGRGRATGFAQIALRDGVAHLVWTDVVAGKPQLRGARVRTATP